jgi:hypothetical protein
MKIEFYQKEGSMDSKIQESRPDPKNFIKGDIDEDDAYHVYISRP